MNKGSECGNVGLGIGDGVWEEAVNDCHGISSCALARGVEVCKRENGLGAWEVENGTVLQHWKL